MGVEVTLIEGDHAATLVGFNSGHFFAEAENRSLAAHVLAQGFDDFGVHKVGQRRARLV